jgi:S1-C subfamily serine protease
VSTAAAGVVIGATAVLVVLGSSADGAEQALVRLSAATVQVRATGCGPDLAATGVRLDDGRVLTNRHAVRGERVVVDGRVADRVRVGTGADLATIAGAGRGVGLRVAKEAAAPGEAVWVASRRGGRLTIEAARITSAVRGTGPDDPPFAWRLDRSAVPGDSGGPVVDAAGHLVGIVYAAEYGSTAALVVPIGDLERERFVSAACS